MPTDAVPAATATTPRWLTALIAIGLPLAGLIVLGQDANFDLWNYHLYNAHAWLHGRYAIDIAPAGMQSWHNPLLDVPLAWLTDFGAPGFVVGLWLTLPTMLAFYLLLRMPAWLGQPLGAAPQFALALMALTGAGVASALGASFDDAFVAAGILAALALALTANGRFSRWLLAGVVAGATAGLKLTATGYCLALVAACLPLGPLRELPRRLGALALGGVLGALLTYGDWGLHLWNAFGNPVFPYFNQWFHSPLALPAPYADERFNPKTFLDAVLVPWRLLFKNQHYSELTLRDPRLLLGWLALPWLAWRLRSRPVQGRAWLALLLFYLVAFSLWCLQSGIYRYLVVLELLAVLACAVLLARLRPRWLQAAVFIIAVLALASYTRRPNWGRTPFTDPFLPAFAPALPADSLVLLSGIGAQGYLAAALPDSVPVYGIENSVISPGHCTGLRVAIGRKLRAQRGPVWSLGPRPEDAPEHWRRYERRYGLFVEGACRPVVTPHETLSLCPLRLDPAHVDCPTATPPGR
jgi:hypothetical protein